MFFSTFMKHMENIFILTFQTFLSNSIISVILDFVSTNSFILLMVNLFLFLFMLGNLFFFLMSDIVYLILLVSGVAVFL